MEIPTTAPLAALVTVAMQSNLFHPFFYSKFDSLLYFFVFLACWWSLCLYIEEERCFERVFKLINYFYSLNIKKPDSFLEASCGDAKVCVFKLQVEKEYGISLVLEILSARNKKECFCWAVVLEDALDKQYHFFFFFYRHISSFIKLENNYKINMLNN